MNSSNGTPTFCALFKWCASHISNKDWKLCACCKYTCFGNNDDDAMITRTSERRSTVSKRKKKGEREREEKQSRHGRHKHIVKRETNALVNTPSARLLFSSRKERANFSNSSKSSSSSSPPPSRRKKKKRTPAVLISRSSVEPLLSARARPRFASSRV